MSDDTFHLTPHDIRAQEFQKTLRGFDPAEVESFKERVAEELDRLLRERTRADERMKGLVEQLRTHREREQALNDALIAAQRLRADIQAQAGREAEVVLAEARQEAARLLNDASSEEQGVRHRVTAAALQLQTYVATFRTILDRHQAELDALESFLEREFTREESDGVPAS